MLKVVVLGAAAGGGFPQWNCNCDICRAGWAGNGLARPATQSSLAVSADGETWFLLNASPDIRQQIGQTPALHPREGRRHSPIGGVLLTNADVDHVAGLLTLRESQPFSLYGTGRVLGVLTANSIFNVVNPDFVQRNTIELGENTHLLLADGRPSGLSVEMFPVPGKVALWLEDESAGKNFGTVAEDTVGVKVSDGERAFFYIPGCASCPPELAERIEGADLLFFDGTTWIDDEMSATGVGHKTGQRMGHMCMSGPDGSIAAMAPLGIGRKIFIHINNTNPVHLVNSPERAEAGKDGWEIAYDGMEVEL
ncbi:MAG: pyrroloquinoline quinone biosynthesis protein PqqB [Proteobacteria bacterium]|nr:pyrroloquinoline quinone biosynthesis protein PqqB [Pseudomonadota bacterium]